MSTAIHTNRTQHYWRFAETSTRVLVVDDQKEMREYLCDILTKAGCEAVCVAGGEEAVKVCRRERISVIVVDIFMPDKDGIETIMDIRRCSPEAKLIAMTGRVKRRGIDVLNWARKLGAHAVLTKPFTQDELLSAVASVVGVTRQGYALAG